MHNVKLLQAVKSLVVMALRHCPLLVSVCVYMCLCACAPHVEPLWGSVTTV